MKKIMTIIMALAMAIGMIGCYYDVNKKKIEIGTMDNYFFDDSEIPILNSIKEYSSFLNKNISFNESWGGYWKLPEETWKSKSGSCEDFIILFMYLVKTRLNIEPTMTAIQKIGYQPYPLARIDDIYYEVVFASFYNINDPIFSSGYSVAWEYAYNQVIWMTYYYHRKL